MAMNNEPHQCVIFVQSTKIGTHENKAIHSIYPHYINYWCSLLVSMASQLVPDKDVFHKPARSQTRIVMTNA